MVRMTNKEIAECKFRRASDDASAAKLSVSTPQTESEAYKLAFQDTEFLLREDLRPVRFQLELLKPELLLDRSEEHKSELQSLMRISYAVFCLNKKNRKQCVQLLVSYILHVTQ